MTVTTRSNHANDWDKLLAEAQTDSLDCLQSAPALVADWFHGIGTHLALGATWGFAPGPDGHLSRSADERLKEAELPLGLSVARTWRQPDGPVLRGAAREAGFLYVVGDAFTLPWVPYVGHAHMAHGYLLCDGPGDHVTVVDAYHNDTRWGPARPGMRVLPAAEFDCLLTAGSVGYLLTPVKPETADTGAVLAANARERRAAAPVTARYLERIRAGLGDEELIDHLVLDVWLLSRERGLHLAWLRSRNVAQEAITVMSDLVGRWQGLATHSYVALRQLQRGHPVNGALLDRAAALLADDADVADALAELQGSTSPHASDQNAVGVVRLTLREALGVDDATLDRVASLRELPGFDSYRLVEILDLVEQRLSLRWDAAELSAEALCNAASLARLFRTAEESPIGTGR